MTSKQVLDDFSETLMQDDRILSPREREFLTSLLQNAKEASSNSEIEAAVSAVVARTVGETVAQRAFTLLGSHIVEKILGSGAHAASDEPKSNAMMFAGPDPPGRGPDPPGRPQPDDQPIGPDPPGRGPDPPGISLRESTLSQAGVRPESGKEQSGVAVMDAPAVVRAQCVVLDEFLAPQEMEELVRYTLEHEAEFRNSSVVSPSGDSGTIDFDHRRSRVLMNLGTQEAVFLKPVKAVLPGVLEQLGMDEFPITQTEVQITASNDGDFFRAHCDDAQETIASRRLTFVYFFHREPAQFEGGELRLHDSVNTGHHPVSAGSLQKIVPQQNQIVFFPCSTLHEITPVQCRSRAFADSRFTVNGWLHR
jgi:Rps23 Pro-64 3,4-dihydroxylase Tpa1-like proline 4-hydroxylase